MEDFEMHAMSVGDRICEPSVDGIIFELTDTGAVLLLKFRNPTAKETRNITKDLPRFKLAIVDDIYLFWFVSVWAAGWMRRLMHGRPHTFCPALGRERAWR